MRETVPGAGATSVVAAPAEVVVPVLVEPVEAAAASSGRPRTR